ncbi:MRE11 [Enterospora canceri]|uniref:MRE11 n=1 Tax=Enterospora canceri TaxID=1081671 RepID=A0A1Y1S841_9MICR|nr:MRE11 [Enterospora canceri]
MKILVTSDNHLGYSETDPIRGNDSFDTFKEILGIAADSKVDLVLQGGDLFHYNKPSRNTYNKTLQILQQFQATTPIRILAIHGNHDDPSGFNSVSPMDVMHSSGLLEYIGRNKACDGIEIEPIQLGSVALYALGYVKDAKLFRMLETNKIYYNNLCNNNYNILMLHQNRAYKEGMYVPLEHIPSEFDLVIFGHEHLSEKVTGKHFEIIQVGSSVRTSLCLDERGDKYAYLVELEGKSARITRQKLKSVRPFYMDSMRLDEDDFKRKLARFVEISLMEMDSKRENEMAPLLRLRVECPNGCKFERLELDKLVEGRIANVGDYLKLTKKNQKKDHHVEVKKVKACSFEELFHGILRKMELRVLGENELRDALVKSVKKGDKRAFADQIAKCADEIVDGVKLDEIGAEELESIIKRAI